MAILKVELQQQIETTLRALEAQLQASGEGAVYRIVRRYERARLALQQDGETWRQSAAVTGILNCARGYLESSSRWDQPFLHEMGRTEEMVKKL